MSVIICAGGGVQKPNKAEKPAEKTAEKPKKAPEKK